MARRPSLRNAVVELGFVAVASGIGAVGAPLWAVGLLIAAMILYWLVSRRAALSAMRAMRPGALIGSALVSITLLSAVLCGAFFLGRAMTGWTQ
ncbi:MAG: hypothetical protein AB7L65_03700 [Hyphomonadaceae bacterium]